MSLNLRASARAIILDEDDHVLLCRFVSPHPAVPDGVPAVWTAPGGGIEPGEDGPTALRRELAEETGLVVGTDLPHVWHQVVVAVDHPPGFDGLVNDYYLVRAGRFEPRGDFTRDQLATDEHLAAFRWWPLADIIDYSGPDLFSPRDLATPLTALLASGPPAAPVTLGNRAARAGKLAVQSESCGIRAAGDNDDERRRQHGQRGHYREPGHPEPGADRLPS